MPESAGYTNFMLGIAQVFEVLAALMLVAGLVWSVVLSVRAWKRTHQGTAAYTVARQSFGGAILLSLEVLVAGDLIRTVAVEPTLDNVIVLAIIVVIRTFLSFSLEIEIDGVAPWRRAFVSGATVMRNAAKTANPPSSGPTAPEA